MGNKIAVKKLWSLAGIFMILLVLTLPVYSASALAATVQIQKNSGEEGVNQFIDAQGDVWTVQALIANTNEPSINPEKVKLKLENNQAVFDSCTPTDFGITCEYISPLTEGVREDEHSFTVVYELGGLQAVSGSEVIKADGSAPFLKHLNVRQMGTNLTLDFEVSDKYEGKPSVGIKTIEIIDAESNLVLETITFPEPGTEVYNNVNDGQSAGILPVQLTGQGPRQIKLRMEDWLGHTQTAFASTFQTDFVPPEIIDYLNLTQVGEFIGSIVVLTDIIVGIKGEQDLKSVRGYSEQAGLNGEEAAKLEENEEQGIIYFIWRGVEISPQETFSLKVVAEDASGNVAEKVLTKTLILDTSVPVVEFFGSDRVFNGQSYVQEGLQKIILIASDQGSWLEKEDIAANLVALGGSTYQEPKECQQLENIFVCVWELSQRFESSGMARISLSEFSDRVGNQGEMPEAEVFMDATGPKVESLEIYGSSGTDKNYFQSNDRLKLKLTALESSGLLVLVNLNGLVMDAQTLFPTDYVQKGIPAAAGWQVFTQDQCELSAEGKWECVLETAPLKSGPDQNVELEIMVTDTAGNPASAWEKEPKNVEGSRGNYKFDLLGLTDEVNPDYWEVGSIKLLLPFVDLDVAELNYARMPFTVRLQSDNSRARVLSIELLDCAEGIDPDLFPNVGAEEANVGAESEAAEVGTEAAAETEAEAESASAPAEASGPALSRNLLQGGNFPDGSADPVTNLLLEFSPFKAGDYFVLEDKFEQAAASYTCQLLVYSRVNDQALAQAEVQTVMVEVPFAFSTLGSVDESVKQKIESIWDETFMEIADVLATLEEVIGWLNWLLNIAQLLYSIDTFITLVEDSSHTTGQAVFDTGLPFLEALGLALMGQCLVLDQSSSMLHEVLSVIQVPASILSCNPNLPTVRNEETGKDEPIVDLGFYSWWQRGTLEAYNAMSTRSLVGQPATSLYDNIYTSMIGLCVPGIIHNLNKLREVNCRQIVCYGREVPQGVATMESCDRLHDLQICEFWAGPALDFSPLGGFSVIGRMLKSAFTSPVGLINVVDIGTCAALCFDETPGAGLITACKLTKGLTTVLNFINSIATIIESPPWEDSGSTTYYCDQAENIDLEALAG